MKSEREDEKLARFQNALQQLIDRVRGDRYVLAVILDGSLSLATIWHRVAINVWIIEADGATRRLRSDGNDERIFRILVENGINIHAEVIPRSRFKQMVEGSSRTAFSCNFFAERKVVYSNDPSIESWFKQANTVAIKDQERELLAFSTWTIHAVQHARKRLEIKQDVDLAGQDLLSAAHSLAYAEIIRKGTVWEGDVIYRAMELDPELFQIVYLDVLAGLKKKKVLQAAIARIDAYLDQHYKAHLKPLLALLKKENRVMPLSEISDYFAYSQVYPSHLESSCEWLERKGVLQKFSAPFKLTRRSSEEVEEPAYLLES
jgi:hypothetical protein